MSRLSLICVFAMACTGPVAPPLDTDTDTDVDPGTPPPVDTDGDGFTDDVDNCTVDPNPDQADFDTDGAGDVCDPDVDGDQIPEAFDLFPLDPNAPGTALPDSAYAHTDTDLYRFDVLTNGIELIGTTTATGTLTDIAIDRYGVLYAITFDDLYVCHPQTAECWLLGALPASSNGLSFLPSGTLLPDRDALVGIAQDGTWSLLTVNGGTVEASAVGGYGPDWGSSGDVFSILGTGTFASVDQGIDDDVIVEVDPSTGAIIRQVASVPYTGIWGIAGWDDVIFAFDSTGDVLQMNPADGTWSLITNYGVSWYGAGVRTETAQPSF